MADSDTSRVIIADQQQPRRFTIGVSVLREYGIILAFLAVFVTLSLLTPAFFSIRNILNVLDQSSQVGLVAIGATVTIIGGGFDLSAGAVFAAAGAAAVLDPQDKAGRFRRPHRAGDGSGFRSCEAPVGPWRQTTGDGVGSRLCEAPFGPRRQTTPDPLRKSALASAAVAVYTGRTATESSP